MARSNKFLTTLVLGAAAAAVFLATKTGKTVKDKVVGYIKDYQEDPEAKHAEWVDKAQELKDQAMETYSDVKYKFETGELTTEDLVESVRTKATAIKERISQEEFFTNLKEQAAKLKSDATEVVVEEEGEVVSEEITIDLTEEDLPINELVFEDPSELSDTIDSL